MNLTPTQQAAADRARAYLDASRQGGAALAVHLEISADPGTFYPTALGAADHHIAVLLNLIGELTWDAS